MALSPMMQQYMDIKSRHEDCILFFRLGDFYEMFFEDAKTASKELELTLTGKNCGLEERAPMCGVPFHSADGYIARLVEKGYRVAICEQIEDPSASKGIVKREVIRIVTPGTVTDNSILSAGSNNFLASVFLGADGYGLSYVDISTGECKMTVITGENADTVLLNELVRISPAEIIYNEDGNLYSDMADRCEKHLDTFLSPLSRNYFAKKAADKAVRKQFGDSFADTYDSEDKICVKNALGGQIIYLMETQKQNLGNLTEAEFYSVGNTMALDRSTIRNLELTETLFEKKKHGSLLGVLDRTCTAMGARKIRQWLREPLNNSDDINLRLDAVEYFTDELMCANNLRESLKSIYDFERLAGKITYGSANGKDLIALKKSLYMLPEIRMDLEGTGVPLLDSLAEELDSLSDIWELIERSICEDSGISTRDGNIIKEGYSSELDTLKDSIRDAREWILGLEASERERTGISNLKVGYNKVFGYYIDVTRSNTDKVPEDYIRKQTLVNSERYITPELKETEALVLNAETKINSLEYDLFDDIRCRIRGEIRRIQKTSKAVAVLDVLLSFANVSVAYGYVKPELYDGDEIIIEKGRHPVVEQMIKDGIFVANDLYINRDDASMLLITGPNMAGKSTYMRQTAIIVLMAQSGCFVPCQRAKIGTVDRIFTRIGASDNLTGGQSTFYVEMSELAYILESATTRSLVILDEIGRGTSTYDGLSIAWAAVEYLCRSDRKIRTLFASHYHELTAMEKNTHGFRNLNVDVAEENGEVIFLHRIVEGSASRSYGIHVAKLAGVPSELLENAQNKLDELEKNSGSNLNMEDSQISFIF